MMVFGVVLGLIVLAVGIPLFRMADRECSEVGFLTGGLICFAGFMLTACCAMSLAGIQ